MSASAADGWNQLADDLDRDFFESAMQLLPMTVARVLGHALRHAPNADGHNVLAREIMGCEVKPEDSNCSPELLAALALFHNPKGPTPCISVEQSPRHSFEQAVNDGNHPLQTSALRKRVLYRDENRCAFTGGLDVNAFSVRLSDGPPPQVTRTTHIISHSFSSGIGGLTQADQRKFNWASTAAAVLERFGGFSAYDILGDDNLNNAANAFTAGSREHIFFDKLYLWLVPATSVHPDLLAGLKQTVSFREVTMDDIVVGPPSSQLLALHATCAQVAHSSAAAEHLDDIFGDPDVDCMVMTQPESADILTKKLRALTIIPLAT